MTMLLYHHPICPLSRQIRFYLKELNIPFNLVKEDYWHRRKELLAINFAATLPILQTPSGLTICNIYPIIEYLNEQYQNFYFLTKDITVNCEIRRLISWFNDKFYLEVTKIFIDEKIALPNSAASHPRTSILRDARASLIKHLDYLSNLLETGTFIASDCLSAADVAMICHLSILDYFNEINWNRCGNIHYYYAILKSRPSFQQFFQDRIAGFSPPVHYVDLDF
jgi:glutathione S-transferase